MRRQANFRFGCHLCCFVFLLDCVVAVVLPFRDSSSSRIVNGENASKGEFPWMAMITDGLGRQYCGGALLNHRYVLTAAHCVLGDPLNNPPNLLVRLGALQKNVHEDGAVTHRVARIVKHPNYVDEGIISDIALLELADIVQYTDTIKPIHLPDASFNLAGEMATVTGWGLLNPGGESSDTLQKAEVPILSDTACKERYEGIGKITEDMFCAGGNGKNPCSQDSGGPLIWQDGQEYWYVVGVVSWGSTPCGSNPIVFSSVKYALPWILTTVG